MWEVDFRGWGGSKILNILWTSCKHLPRPRCGWSGAATGSPSSTATPTGSSPSRATSSPSRDQPWLTKTLPRWKDSEMTGFGRCCLFMVHVENYKWLILCWLSCRMNNLSSGRLYSIVAYPFLTYYARSRATGGDTWEIGFSQLFPVRQRISFHARKKSFTLSFAKS